MGLGNNVDATGSVDEYRLRYGDRALCNPMVPLIIIALYVGYFGVKTHAYMMDLVDNQLAACDLKVVTAPLVVKALKEARMSDWEHVSILQ